jgi:DNA-binding NarL/FixJ family response regulator
MADAGAGRVADDGGDAAATDMIAARLFLSRHTVKTRMKAIGRKLGVSSRKVAVYRRQRPACSPDR